MKVLLTGIEGYLGAVAAPVLLEHGHEVTGLDTGFYKSGWLYHVSQDTPRTISKDIRQVTKKDLEGFEAVVHMAELSNDPAGELAPAVTYQINHEGSVRLASLARDAGVSRFVYMSSCSVYGVADESYVTEQSPLSPQTAYAICKTLVERDLKPMAGDDFSPTFLRNATAHGASPRMRFDIVLNNLAGLAWTTREIRLVSDGTPWRPLVHALDIARAIACVLDAPRQVVHNQIFNVGHSDHNYTIRQIAECVATLFPDCALVFGRNGADNRSYRVSFDKIHEKLPGFHCAWDAAKGARQLFALFERIQLTPALFNASSFTRVKQLQHLLLTRQIDEEFFWKNGVSPTATP